MQVLSYFGSVVVDIRFISVQTSMHGSHASYIYEYACFCMQLGIKYIRQTSQVMGN